MADSQDYSLAVAPPSFMDDDEEQRRRLAGSRSSLGSQSQDPTLSSSGRWSSDLALSSSGEPASLAVKPPEPDRSDFAQPKPENPLAVKPPDSSQTLAATRQRTGIPTSASTDIANVLTPPNLQPIARPALLDAPRRSLEGFKSRMAEPANESLNTTAGGPTMLDQPGSAGFYQDKIARIEDQKANPWGSPENHPGTLGKIGHVLGRIGNIAGDIAAPNAMAIIPGTDLNRQEQESGLENRFETATNRENRAAEAQSKADYRKAEAENASNKTEEAANKAKDVRELALRKIGMKTDAAGQAVPLTRDEMSSTEQAHQDLQEAQTEVAQARAEYEQTKADPNSPQNKAALGRIQVAAKNASTAAGKLGLDKDKFNADYLGLDREGKPLAGTQRDEAGNPIGPRVANANNTPADRLKRSDLAVNVQTNTKGMREIINRRPDLFGKMAGRITSVEQMIGSDDPDIAKMGVAVHNAALASNGAHGIRSAEAVHDTEKEILNHFRNGPEATIGALDELDQSVQTFIEDAKRGKRPGNSPNATPAGEHKGGAGGDKVTVISNGVRGTIPKERLDEAKKRDPKLQVVQ